MNEQMADLEVLICRQEQILLKIILPCRPTVHQNVVITYKSSEAQNTSSIHINVSFTRHSPFKIAKGGI